MSDVELEKLKEILLGMSTKEQLDVSQVLLDELYGKSETYGWTDKSFEADRISKVFFC